MAIKLPWWGWAIGGVFVVGSIAAVVGEDSAETAAVAAAPEKVRFSGLRTVFPDGFVGTVGRDATPEGLLAAAREKCEGRAICQVRMWFDADLVPTAWPMTDREVAGLVFTYTLNRNTGLDEATYDCAAFPTAPKDRCAAAG